MERTYKFRIYPNNEQKKQIARNFGCCRFLYNYALAERKDLYVETGKSTTWQTQANGLKVLKQEFEWLKEADATSLQSTLKNLHTAYGSFFRDPKNIGFPKWKSKHSRRQSYKSVNNGVTIRIEGKKIRLPKLGLVTCKMSKQVEGRILSATVSRNPSDKYFVAICCTDVGVVPLPKTGAVVGLDLGIKSLAVTSDGVEYPSHKFLRKSEKKLAKLQRQLSRKQKGSNNREKARIRVARLHEKISNQRKDSLHKLSIQLVKDYDIICIEDLTTKNMVRNRKLSKSISDAGWGEFRRQLTYKSDWYDKQVKVVDRFYPSSQLCSSCGEKWQGTKDLAVRNWTCDKCGATLDRDINASINILNEGMRIID